MDSFYTHFFFQTVVLDQLLKKKTLKKIQKNPNKCSIYRMSIYKCFSSFLLFPLYIMYTRNSFFIILKIYIVYSHKVLALRSLTMTIELKLMQLKEIKQLHISF